MPATLELNDAEVPAKEFFKRAFMGEPQIVTRQRKAFVDFLRSCPVDLAELDLGRDKDTVRDMEYFAVQLMNPFQD